MSDNKLTNRKEDKFNLLEEACKQSIYNNLPPELVEKIKNAFINRKCKNRYCADGQIRKSECNICKGNEYLGFPEQCAQIAVDYADSYKQMLDTLVKDHNRIEKQRDELLTALRITNKRLFMALDEPEYNSFIDRNNKLLKKHEDGKE